MALKVVFVLLVAMLLFTKNNGEIVGGVKECLEECMPSCGEEKHCKSACAVLCAFSATYNVEIQTRECNIGCSLGHCYKFLINKYDHEKFGGCMTSCNDNYCVDGKIIALSKA
ncbi:hypothetical protein MTR67_042366 [Solanum verrucosum]|uniref:Uncharacterized protein n=1 Tax=Solanum verrucosum TaxID=315347 RepID=A0AAF0UP69_SOLVR|nr:hypothetical protein MTR67_042366 [Solanum verrucosum]